MPVTFDSREAKGAATLEFQTRGSASSLVAMLERTQDMSEAMATVMVEMIGIVDRHFDTQQGPDGPWPKRSAFTFHMADSSEDRGGPRVHTGLLLRDRGTFRASFGEGAESGTHHAAVGSALRTPDGKYTLASIHHEGVSINVTDRMRGWFLANFGIRLQGATIYIPPRPVLWLSKRDRSEIREIIRGYLFNG